MFSSFFSNVFGGESASKETAKAVDQALPERVERWVLLKIINDSRELLQSKFNVSDSCIESIEEYIRGAPTVIEQIEFDEHLKAINEIIGEDSPYLASLAGMFLGSIVKSKIAEEYNKSTDSDRKRKRDQSDDEHEHEHEHENDDDDDDDGRVESKRRRRVECESSYNDTLQDDLEEKTDEADEDLDANEVDYASSEGSDEEDNNNDDDDDDDERDEVQAYKELGEYANVYSKTLDNEIYTYSFDDDDEEEEESVASTAGVATRVTNHDNEISDNCSDTSCDSAPDEDDDSEAEVEGEADEED